MKPHVGFLIPRLGIVDRGAEIFVYELAKNLCSDFRITIWVRKSAQPSALISDLEKRGVLVESVNSISDDHWLARSLHAFKPLQPIVEKFHLTPFEIEMLVFSFVCLPHLVQTQIDILFPANGFWGVLVCYLVRLMRKIPFVYTSLGGIEPLTAKLKPNIYITINQGIKRWLKKYYPHLYVVFISTGVDLNKFKPLGKKAEINLPPPVFITVSALIPSKRVDLTIQAVAALEKGSLLIVGDGPLKPKLAEMAQKYLGRNRFLFQRVGYDELDKYYRAADVFTHSAPGELGWSIVILEALATNLPVVANSEENLKKLLNNTGVFCDVTDIDAYSQALRQALHLRPIRSRKAVEKFSWGKISGKYKKILDDLL